MRGLLELPLLNDFIFVDHASNYRLILKRRKITKVPYRLLSGNTLLRGCRMLNMTAAFKWTDETASQVCEDIESGLTLRAVAEKNGISKALILKKVAISPEFRDQYARAMDVRTEVDCDALADQIAQEPETNNFGVDSGWVAWQRVRVDTMKWLLSKRNPKKYGERTTLAGDPEAPLVLADRIANARKRAK